MYQNSGAHVGGPFRFGQTRLVRYPPPEKKKNVEKHGGKLMESLHSSFREDYSHQARVNGSGVSDVVLLEVGHELQLRRDRRELHRRVGLLGCHLQELLHDADKLLA